MWPPSSPTDFADGHGNPRTWSRSPRPSCRIIGHDTRPLSRFGGQGVTTGKAGSNSSSNRA
jgi:hypothetical protein